MSGKALTIVALASVGGASLASGIMWYRMAIDGFDYTRQSWLLIAPLWSSVFVSGVIATRQALGGGVLVVASSFVAAWYFSDVYGFAPAAVTFGIGIDSALSVVLRGRKEASA